MINKLTPAQIQPKLLRITFIFVAVIGSLALGVAASQIDPLFALILAVTPLMIFLGLLLLNILQWTPVLLLIAAAFIPLSLPTGRGSRIVDSLLLTTLFVGLWLLKMLIIDRHIKLEPSPVNKPLVSFIIVTLISFAWGIVFRDPNVIPWASFTNVQIASTLVFIMLPGAFLLVANLVHQEKILKTMSAVVILAGILGLLKNYLRLPLPVNTEGLFAMWVIALSTGLALFNRSLHWLIRLILALLAVGWVYWGFGLNISWVAGWLPGLITISILFFIRSKKLFFILIIITLLLGYLQLDYFQGVISRESNTSGSTRLAAWQMNWQVTGQHILFGTGPAGYAVYYMNYFPTQAMATHNNYLDILSQTGIVGLVILLWFFGALLIQGYQLLRRLRRRADFLEAQVAASLAGTIACLVMMALGDWQIPFAYTQTIEGFDYVVYNWIFMGIILVIDRLSKKMA